MSKVSIVMPVYNRGNQLLHNSITSVLNQSLRDFEFLILDDGSTDNTLEIIKQYATQDKRIRVLQNDQNQGIPFSTNRLLDNANTNFVALLDSDDTCFPNRLEKQYEFFQKHPDIDIIGSHAQCFQLLSPSSDWEIKTILSFYTPALLNPSTMMRMEKINANNIRYRSDFPFSQDYQFWIECTPFVKFANMDEVLIHRTVHVDQTSMKGLKRQKQDHIATLQGSLQKYNIDAHDRTLRTLLGWQEHSLQKQDIHNTIAYIINLLDIKDFHGYSGVHEGALRLILNDLHRHISNYAHYTTKQKSSWGKEISRMTRKYKSIHSKVKKKHMPTFLY